MLIFASIAAFAQDVAIRDTLYTGSSATMVFGGTFTGAGWRVDDSNSRMTWDFGTQVDHGSVSVTIDDLTLDGMGPANNHVIELFDSGGHWTSQRAINVRIYGNGSADEAGQVKLKAWDPSGAAEERTAALTWDGTPHRFTVTWDATTCSLDLDGTRLITLDVTGIDLRVGNLWLPLEDWTGDYSGGIGSIYHDLDVEAYVPATSTSTGPADDGDPNTLPPVADVSAVSWESGVYSEPGDLCAESSGGVPDAVAYLKFDTSAFSGHLDKATLRLHARTDGSAQGDGGEITAVSDTSWSEDALTWATRPATGTAVGTYPPIQPGDVVDVDVTRAVSLGGLVSLALVAGGDNGVHFSSKEDADGAATPLLILSVSPDSGDTDTDADAYTDTDAGAVALDTAGAPWPADVGNVSRGCGCEETGGAPIAWALAVVALLVSRRRT